MIDQCLVKALAEWLDIVLQCLNENIVLHKIGSVSEFNPFVKLFNGLDSEYLIALNIGAVWNVIALWIYHSEANS